MSTISKDRPMKRWAWLVLLPLCLLDLVYSTYQHYSTQLEGDLAPIVVPSTAYQTVLEAPFGVAAVAEGKTYAGTNRFFCHYSMKAYFSTVPSLIGRFTNNIDALYWSSAVFKTFVQALLLVMIGLYAHSLFPVKGASLIVLLFLLTPFFQVEGYAHVLGLINPSITYTFFYSWPVAMLLLFYYPFFRSFMRQESPQISLLGKLGLILLALFLSFSSPINAPVILLVSLLYASNLFLRFRQRKMEDKTTRQWLVAHVPPFTVICFGTISLLALYSLYLGQFNVENTASALPLLERYSRLVQGLTSMLTIKLAYPVLLVALLISWQLAKKEDTGQLRQLVRWLTIFSVLYLLLLPLGGYRSYRPYIVRTDTTLPIVCGILVLYGALALHLLRRLNTFQRRAYSLLLLAVVVIFSVADKPNFTQNANERAGLQVLQNSTSDTVVLPKGQLVLSWDNIEHPAESHWNAMLLERVWITDTLRLYYNE